jgi:hypothetical protein
MAESAVAEEEYLAMLPVSMEAVRAAHSLMHASLHRVNLAVRDAGDARDTVEALRRFQSATNQRDIAAEDGAP